MNSNKRSPLGSRQEPRSRVWLLAPILAVSFVLVWAVGAHTAPAASTSVSGAQSTSTGTLLSAPAPFLSPLLNGRVALERRGSPGDPRWITPLYRDEGGVITDGIQVYQPGTFTSPLRTYNTTTDANGAFSVRLDGLWSGVYDIRIKGGDTLSVRKASVTVPPASAVDFGTLLVGDSTGNDVVNADDVSYMVPSFLLCTGDVSYRIYADTNKSKCVNGLDVSALVPNYLRQGPVLTGLQTQLASNAAASLALSPSDTRVAIDEVFTIDIMGNTGAGAADTVQAYIAFDPAYLEVVDSSGQPADKIELNTAVFTSATWNSVDNGAGTVDLSATQFVQPYISGTRKVATIRLKAKALTSGTTLTFAHQAEPRLSDLSLAGTSLSPTISGATVGINSYRVRVYLPVVFRG